MGGTRIGIYPGQYFDSETGLHYNYFRYYDPKIGRYLRADPLDISERIIRAEIYAASYSEDTDHEFKQMMVLNILMRNGILIYPQKQNIYSYAVNNSINNIDPKGLTVVIPTPGGPLIIPMPPPPSSTVPTVGTPSIPPIPPPDWGGFDVDLCKSFCDAKFECKPIRRRLCKNLCWFTALAAFLSDL